MKIKFKRVISVLAIAVIAVTASAVSPFSGGESFAASGIAAVRIFSPSKGTAYTKELWTTLYKKQSAGSKSVRVWYGSKLKIIKKVKKKGGTWTKVRYRNKTYYLWQNTGTSKLMKKAIPSDFTRSGYSDYQNAILRKAMFVYNNWKTSYDTSHKADRGVKASNGRYPFDCSGFVSYVFNEAFQPECPPFSISRDDLELYNTSTILNAGEKGEIKAKVICKKKPDFKRLKPGDILFFKEDPSSKAVINHVGIYLGDKKFIHSTKMYAAYPGDKNGGVCISPLNKGKYYLCFVSAKRMTPSGFRTIDKEMTIKDWTKIYSDAQCHKALTSSMKGGSLKLLYTVNRKNNDGSYTKVAYVEYKEGNYGYVLYSKLK